MKDRIGTIDDEVAAGGWQPLAGGDVPVSLSLAFSLSSHAHSSGGEKGGGLHGLWSLTLQVCPFGGGCGGGVPAAAEEESEEKNAMKALEERTKESRQEMDILDALEEIKDANARAAQISLEGVLAEQQVQEQEQAMRLARRMQLEEEAAVQAAFGGNKQKASAALCSPLSFPLSCGCA